MNTIQHDFNPTESYCVQQEEDPALLLESPLISARPDHPFQIAIDFFKELAFNACMEAELIGISLLDKISSFLPPDRTDSDSFERITKLGVAALAGIAVGFFFSFVMGHPIGLLFGIPFGFEVYKRLNLS